MSVDIVARGMAASQSRSGNTASLIAAIRNYGFVPAPTTRLAPADTPVLTLGAASAASTINANGVGSPNVLCSNSKLQWLSGPTVLDGTGAWYPRGSWYGASRDSSYASIEFNHTGTTLEFSFVDAFAGLPSLRVLVNDKNAGYVTTPGASGSFYYLKLTFPASATRRIRIEGARGKFRGINVASTSEISATGRNYPLITVMGDSFVEGSGSAPRMDSEVLTMARALGCHVAQAGVGGTGILNPGIGGRVAWTDATRLTDLTHAGVIDAAQGFNTAPAAGVVMMSINDGALAPAIWSTYGSTYQAAVNNRVWAIIDAWVAANPGRPLVFFGPTSPTESVGLDMYRLRDATQEACVAAQQSNVWFIDRYAPNTILRKGTLSRTVTTGSTTNASAVITGLASTNGVAQGSGVVGNGIATGARVMSVDSATQVTLDIAATATAAGVSLTFQNDQAGLYTVTTDPTHPSATGHIFDGLWMAQQLRRLFLTEFA